MTPEERANDLLARLERGEIDRPAALSALADLGVHPAHAEEMLAIASGEGDAEPADLDQP